MPGPVIVICVSAVPPIRRSYFNTPTANRATTFLILKKDVDSLGPPTRIAEPVRISEA